MMSKEKEIINDETETKNVQEKPFQWGDELEPKEEKSELDGDGHPYTSVTQMLEDEEEIERKRLEEYFKKLFMSSFGRNNSRVN